MSDEKKRLLSGWDKLWLLIVVLILAYFVLQKFGVDLFYQTETQEMIQRPHD
ncbi:MAG: hypothetical protein MI974_03440 [Chitinophagales bacterium]|nr:hypothetical protein [Chitinophagales bacterium]